MPITWKRAYIFILLFLPFSKLSAQPENSSLSKTEFIDNTFRGMRLVNNQSTELVGKGELNLMINHRFGLINSGLYNLFGLDEAEIRFGFDYGLTDFLSIGVGRSSYQKTYDFNAKAKILRQQSSGMPINLSGFTSIYYNTLRNIYPADKNNFAGRQSYVAQLLASRKFSDIISMQIETGWLYERYNIIKEDSYSSGFYGIGGKFEILSFLDITYEYTYVSRKLPNTYDPLSFGIDIDTGDHLFQLIFSNSQATFEKALFSDTRSTWSNGEVFFGFNLIRIFYIK